MADTPTFVDMSSMAVGFGGFAPMPYNDVEASARQLEDVQRILAERRESLLKARALEESRLDGPYYFEDDSHNQAVWRYSVYEGSAIRIDGCETCATVLVVPDEIDGKPVSAIGPDALAYLDNVTEIVCPDSVTSIGACAFRRNRNLQKLVLPKQVAEFSSTWIQADEALEELVLPGLLESIGPDIFDASELKRLAIGAAVREIEPGAFKKSQLESIAVDAGNPYLMSDGVGLLTRDGSTFVAFVVPVESYSVPSCCTSIAPKAFFGHESLRAVTLPEGVTSIGMLAFAHTGISSFEAPESLREIGVRAFFHCKNLERVELNGGIRVIGDEAFADSDISSLSVPSTIESIGDLIAVNTRVTFSGPDATFKIVGDASAVHLGSDGGLYVKVEDGFALHQMLDPYARECSIEPGTVEIAAGAFARNVAIEHVIAGEGLKRIGNDAFKGCRALVAVDVPDTLETIGEDAFFGTSLASLRIPKSLTDIGPRALVTSGPNQGAAEPTLAEITVDEGNERYFVDGNLLCERVEGGVRVVVCMANAESVRFPEYITSVAPYAFNGISGLRELYLNAGLKTIGINSLNVACRIEHIHVDMRKPIEGRSSVDLYFPDSARTPRSIALAFGSASWVNVAELYKHYDNCVASGNAVGKAAGMDLYDQARRIVVRLSDPFLLTRYNRKVYDRTISSRLERICVELTRHDDRATLDALVDLGYLNADNIVGVIERVGRMQDAAMTAYLLEIQRTRFNRSILDDLDL